MENFCLHANERVPTTVPHTARVDVVVWYDETQPVTITKLDTGISAIFDELPDDVPRDKRIVIYGELSEGRFGEQIKVTYWHDAENTLKEVTSYLKSAGIPAPVAKEIYTHFGPQSLDLIRAGHVMPELEIAPGMPLNWGGLQSLIIADYRNRQVRIDLAKLFSGHGFPSSTIRDCVDKWGENAVKIVRRDPFSMLIAGVEGVGYKRADKLYQALELPTNRLKRQFLACWAKLREENKTGSTWMATTEVQAAVPDGADPARVISFGLRCGWLVQRDGEIALVDDDIAEQIIAARLQAIIKSGRKWPALTQGDLSDHQYEQLQQVITSPVACLTGGPGTGKTFCVAQLVKSIIAAREGTGLCLAAPTGKAAVRVTEQMDKYRLPIKARTMHSMLMLGVDADTGVPGAAKIEAMESLPYSVFIIDETSMVDAKLMMHFLSRVPNHSCVLFVGDTFQLPPVGRGAPFRDIIQVGQEGGVGVASLTEIQRNSGDIVKVCQAIRNGTFDAMKLNRKGFDDAVGANLLMIPRERKATMAEVLRLVKATGIAQVMVAVNDRGELSRKAFNKAIRELVHPGSEGYQWVKGDKVICLKNHMATVFGTETKEEVYIANGEMGVVTSTQGKAGAVISMPIPGGERKIKISSARGKSGEIQWDYAYALTVHRAQGSEFEHVVCVVDSAGGLVCDPQYWYTDISRAKHRCTIVGEISTLAKQASKKPSLDRRVTRLQERMLSKSDMKTIMEGAD